MRDFIRCGDIIYYLALDHFEPEKISCGKLFYLKKESHVDMNQSDS